MDQKLKKVKYFVRLNINYDIDDEKKIFVLFFHNFLFIIFEKGMPIGLRSMITKENHGEWYRQMYKSLHQPKVKYDYRLAIDNQSIYLKISN